MNIVCLLDQALLLIFCCTEKASMLLYVNSMLGIALLLSFYSKDGLAVK